MDTVLPQIIPYYDFASLSITSEWHVTRHKVKGCILVQCYLKMTIYTNNMHFVVEHVACRDRNSFVHDVNLFLHRRH